jgi:hypothetical protein
MPDTSKTTVDHVSKHFKTAKLGRTQVSIESNVLDTWLAYPGVLLKSTPG